MRRRAKALVAGGAVLAVLGAAVACGGRPVLPLPASALPAAQTGWTVSTAAPVIPAGAMRARALWNDPSVVALPGGGYAMYLTSSVAEPFKPPVLPFRLVSRDARTWRLDPAGPLLPPFAPFASVETPSVVRYRGRWHLFFTGVYAKPDPSPMAIGHAVSPDGIRWRVVRPVLLSATGRTGDWNSYLVAEPGAVVVGDELRVYFSAVGGRTGDGPPQDQSIGVVTSRDGARFSAPVRALRQSATYSGARGYAGYSSPAAAMIGRDLHLFYSVAHVLKGADPEWRQVAIAEAVSRGGTGPLVELPRPVLTVAGTRWAGGEVIGPAPLVTPGRLLLWFGGHARNDALAPLVRRDFHGPEFGIGLAERPLALNDGEPR